MSPGALASHLHEDGDPAGARATATARAPAGKRNKAPSPKTCQRQYLLDRISDSREVLLGQCKWRDELRAALETGSLHAQQRIHDQLRMLYERALIKPEALDRKLAQINALYALMEEVASTPHHACTSARDTVQALARGGVPCAQHAAAHMHTCTTAAHMHTCSHGASTLGRDRITSPPPIRGDEHTGTRTRCSTCTHERV